MALDQGTRFGHYEVTGRLGAGGMGEVFRATDTRLGRSVAIKTLPAALADDADRLARFEREAKLLATLNHPHIAAVYGLDEYDGTRYLVMELVEGRTLEARIDSGALPADEALRLALQIAEALEAAHAKGVVHRDLKPANVMVTADGQVKVLDFGLAKAFSGNPADASPLHSPALSAAMTQQGLVLGTAAYMSPEQASGQGADQRADIWSFGVVLFEMLSGLPLFRGESVPHILADVLKTEPDWSRLPRNLHPRIRQLLERCLTKKPRSRLHSIADARIEIEAALADPAGLLSAAGAAGTGATRSRVPLIAAAMLAMAALGIAVGWLLGPAPSPEPKSVSRFSQLLPVQTSLAAAPVTMVAVSPDGTRIVWAADNQLYLRNLDELDARPIPGTQMTGTYGATTPVFSPDGQSIAFVDAPSGSGPYTIMRLPVNGGTPVRLIETPGTASYPHGISWPTPEWLVFANADGIVRMPANGGAVEVLVPRAADERLYSPQLLPGGDSVLFTSVPGPAGVAGGYEGATIHVQSIGKDDRRLIRTGGRDARYVATGHLIFVEGTTLYALAFDPDTRTVGAGPVRLVDGMGGSSNGFSDTAHYAVSASGALAFVPAPRMNAADTGRPPSSLSWVDRTGAEEPLPIRADAYTQVRISPDGSKAALVVGFAGDQTKLPTIWIYDFGTLTLRLLTTEPAAHDSPLWASDSRRLYFRAPGDNVWDIYVGDIETGEFAVIANGSTIAPYPNPWSLSADAETMALVNYVSDQDISIAVVPAAGGSIENLLRGANAFGEPSISPHGGWIAFHEGIPGGQFQINMRPYPAVARTVVPVGPGETPVFSADGTELFYLDDGWIKSVAVSYEPAVRIGQAASLVEIDGFIDRIGGRAWDPDPSGGRFLMVRDPGASPLAMLDDADRIRVDVVLNWFEELKRRVPTD